ncbi:MAG: hypothetical protein JWL88_200 [Parcubacteria group bacterium]|nr:hypothetical protein [Parcubacteria group bacterium]
MSEICVYLDTVQELAAPHYEFCERIRTEIGLTDFTSSLGPHVTIKAPVEIDSHWVNDLHVRTSKFVVLKQFKPFMVQVHAPAEFPIEGSEDSVLHLPLESPELTDLTENILDFLETDFNLGRRDLEEKSPHLTLMKSLPLKDRESVLSVARSIRWPTAKVVFGVVIIAEAIRQEGKRLWPSRRRIPLYRGP